MLSKTLTQKVRPLGLRLIIQFGSSLEPTKARHEESDIDFAILGRRRLSLEELGQVLDVLADAYQVSPDRIDLVDLRDASGLLAAQIATKGQPVYDADGHQFNLFYVTAIKRSIDEAPLRSLERDLLKQKVQSYA